MVTIWWSEPEAGDIVWCHFPDGVSPKAKPRPALVITVLDDQAPHFHVRVAYGTSQRTTELRRGEFVVQRTASFAAFEAAGLSFDTKFDLKQIIDLPYTAAWFSVPPAAPHGQNPKLGILHPSLMLVFTAAYRGAHSQ